MQPFRYERAESVAEARNALLAEPRARLIAGGTTLIDLMKAGVETPPVVIDINGLPLAGIDLTAGRLRIGALARNADVADDPTVAREFPVLSQALAAGASGQLRNMATVGGNLLQRTRCAYFRDGSAHCNKRRPGSGCDARAGVNRGHALFGTSDACIATHPSDMTTALAALEAQVVVAGAGGERTLALDAFYRLPGDDPERETTLVAGDVIVAVELLPSNAARHSAYVKLRDRASYEFALASAAACIERDAGGTIVCARIALGGVATVPWRARAAEAALEGCVADAPAFTRAAEAAVAGAATTPQNAFRVELAKRALVRALRLAAEPA